MVLRYNFQLSWIKPEFDLLDRFLLRAKIVNIITQTKWYLHCLKVRLFRKSNRFHKICRFPIRLDDIDEPKVKVKIFMLDPHSGKKPIQ